MDVVSFENQRWSADTQGVEFRHTAALGLVENAPVLDIGCGDGLFLALLKERGIEATGTDFSDVAVSRCVSRGLRAVVAHGEKLPFDDRSFETVTLLDVLEHTYDPMALLSEAARIARGSILVSVPNFSSLPARLQTLSGAVPENNRPGKGHVYWFNRPVLTECAAKASLVPGRTRMNTFKPLSYCGGSIVRLWPDLLALSFVEEFRKP